MIFKGLSPASYVLARDMFYRHHEDLVPYPAVGRGLKEEVAIIIHEGGRFRRLYRQQRAKAPQTAVCIEVSDEMAFLGRPYATPLAAPIYAPLHTVAPA